MGMREIFQEMTEIPEFESRIREEECRRTNPSLEVMQINLGKLCNLSCKHCHVEAGPGRPEVMGREVMEACLRVFREQGFSTLDITGGAPEMNPDFRWLVERASQISSHIIVRTNLVILLEKGYEDIPQFYRDRRVEVVCSLPYYRAKDADRQRGDGTFEASVQVLKRLNDLGYGRDSGLVLNLVYNPGGAFFPPDQEAMEREYRERLGAEFGIVFSRLYTITNNPIGRFGSFLSRSGNLKDYMKKLYTSFNDVTVKNMMCRNQLSVAFDGTLYDCDFNQALQLPVETGETVMDLAGHPYRRRNICFDKHCYACTAGKGSSCGGVTEGV